MNNKNHFKVPEGYFEEFHHKLMEQIQPTPTKPHSIFSIPNQWKYAAAVAAIFIIFGVTLIKGYTSTELTYAQAEEYSSEYIDELLDSYPIDDYTFYTYITSNEL